MLPSRWQSTSLITVLQKATTEASNRKVSLFRKDEIKRPIEFSRKFDLYKRNNLWLLSNRKIENRIWLRPRAKTAGSDQLTI